VRFQRVTDSRIEDPDREVTQPLGGKGVCTKWYHRRIFSCRQQEKEKRQNKLELYSVCVTENQHNAAKEMSGTTFGQSSYRKGYVRMSCKIRGDGGSTETST
jgi:hypothetical protein